LSALPCPTTELQSDWSDCGSEPQQAASCPQPELVSLPESELPALPATPPPHDANSIETTTGTSGAIHDARVDFTPRA
jgi:hypothetical protein